MKPAHNNRYLPRQRRARFLVLAWCFLAATEILAADADLKPGDTIGPNNWQRIQGMVGENFLSRIKAGHRSEEHTSELQSLMRISYAVSFLKKKKTIIFA